MTNMIREAQDLLATSWCRGSYRTTDEYGRVTFCSVGALAAVAFDGQWWEAENSDELKVLSNVIAEQYMDRFENQFHGEDFNSWTSEDFVIAFNDDIAESHAEIMAVFDKAAVRLDEINSLK